MTILSKLQQYNYTKENDYLKMCKVEERYLKIITGNRLRDKLTAYVKFFGKPKRACSSCISRCSGLELIISSNFLFSSAIMDMAVFIFGFGGVIVVVESNLDSAMFMLLLLVLLYDDICLRFIFNGEFESSSKLSSS